MDVDISGTEMIDKILPATIVSSLASTFLQDTGSMSDKEALESLGMPATAAEPAEPAELEVSGDAAAAAEPAEREEREELEEELAKLAEESDDTLAAAESEVGMAGFVSPRAPMSDPKLYHMILNYINGVPKMSSITTMAYQMPSKEIKKVDIELVEGKMNVKDHVSSLSTDEEVGEPPKAEGKEEEDSSVSSFDVDAKAGVDLS